MRALFLFLFFFLFFLAGCLNDLDRQSRLLLCQRLSDPSFGDFPACDSVSACISKAHDLSHVDLGLFPPAIQSVYRDYETRLGEAWFHANRLKKSLTDLRSHCASISGAELLQSANQIEYHVLQSVEASDQAYRHASQLIGLEFAFLDQAKIQRVSEERLLDDWTVLNQNRRDLENHLADETTFAGSLFLIAQQTESFFQSQGVFSPPLATRSWQDELVGFGLSSYPKLQNFPLPIPIVAESLIRLLSDQRQTALLDHGFGSLSFDPARGFRLLENWISPNQFLTNRFWSIERSLSENSLAWNARLIQLDQTIAGQSDQIEILFEQLEKDVGPSLDENTWARLSARAPARSLSDGTREFNDWPSFSNGLLFALEKIRRERASLQDPALAFSWGEKDARMKNLAKQTSALLDNATRIQNEIIDGSEQLCRQSADDISLSLNASSKAPLADELGRVVLERIRLFKNAQNLRDRFLECSAFLSAFDEWRNANHATPSASFPALVACVKNIRPLFSEPHFFSSDLVLLKPRYEFLEHLSADYPVDQALGICLSLEHDALRSISQNPYAARALQRIAFFEQSLLDTQKLGDASAFQLIQKILGALESKHSNALDLTTQGVLSFDQWATNGLDEKDQQIQIVLQHATERFLSTHTHFRSAGSDPFDLNTLIESRAIVFFENPLQRDLKGPFFFDVFSSLERVGNEVLPGGIFIQSEEKRLRFALEHLDAEGQTAEFDVRFVIPATEKIRALNPHTTSTEILRTFSFSLPLDATLSLPPPMGTLLVRRMNHVPVDENTLALFLPASKALELEYSEILQQPVPCLFEPVSSIPHKGQTRLEYSFDCLNRTRLDFEHLTVEGPFLIAPDDRSGLEVRREDNSILSVQFFSNQWSFVLPLLRSNEHARGRITFDTPLDSTAFELQKNALEASLQSAEPNAIAAEQAVIASIRSTLALLSNPPSATDWTKLSQLQTKAQALFANQRKRNEAENNLAKELERSSARILELDTIFQWLSDQPGADNAHNALDQARLALETCSKIPAPADCPSTLNQKTLPAIREIRKLLEAQTKKWRALLSKDCNQLSFRSFETLLSKAWIAFNNGPAPQTLTAFQAAQKSLESPCGSPRIVPAPSLLPPMFSSAAKNALSKNLSKLADEWNGLEPAFRDPLFESLNLSLDSVQRLQDRLSQARENHQLLAIENDYNTLQNSLQKTAVARFNENIKILNSAEDPPARAIEETEKAKTAIQKKQFTTALLALENAKHEFETKAPAPLPLFYLVPVLVAIVLLAFVRHHKKTVIAPRTREIKRIEDEW